MQLFNQIKLVFPCLIVMTFASCYYDNELELYGNEECNTSNISYSAFVEPVLETNCYGCHSTSANQGGVNFEGHANLVSTLAAGRFEGAIRHDSGFSPMPQGAPKLSDCTVDKIIAWIEDGALNN